MATKNHHVVCGRHSGIPECCIEWFVGPWQKTILNIPVLWKAYWDYNGEKASYIRCPGCIEGDKSVCLSSCDCEALTFT
jgi:hypothetical protein